MDVASRSRSGAIGPKRQKHYSYNENIDEPAKLIADEPVEIEREVPAEERESVERSKDNGKPESPAFEE
jgi:hypothetical protein